MATTRFLRFGEVTLDLEKHTVLREGLNSHLQEEYWSALAACGASLDSRNEKEYVIHRNRL